MRSSLAMRPAPTRTDRVVDRPPSHCLPSPPEAGPSDLGHPVSEPPANPAPFTGSTPMEMEAFALRSRGHASKPLSASRSPAPAVSQSPFARERDALDFARGHLPDRKPWRAWSNFELIYAEGRVNEVDLLVLTPATQTHIAKLARVATNLCAVRRSGEA